ncbi:MAG: DNA polymerase III subunit alpha [Deltaproteobacteria bacterium]|jgi:DNA polymerase-3 subunit alpha|nr:DNA polymerase III subunit alpha [Deltaproteobacteria bacterium]
MPFVHLHVHSCYSLLDGAIRINDLVQTTASMGMPAVALTDHGQMFGLWAFYNAAIKAGVKPILGVETYVANHGRANRTPNESRHHLILLAQNMTGYRNLCRLISLANLEGFYNKPRVDKELLAEYNEGLIALSGCLQGELPQEILRGSGLDHLAEIAQSFATIFPNRFYLEIQENGLPQQTQVNEALMDLAEKTSLPLVATNDCHYLLKEHHKAHDILLCVQTRKKLTDENRMRMETEEFYFKSPQEMIDSFAYAPEAIANTLAIAEACDLEFPKKTYHYPSLKLPEGQTTEEMLRRQANEGLRERFAALEKRGRGLDEAKKEEYQARLDYELQVIDEMGFQGYFLIVAGFIKWARDHGIMVGPGRGSAAGCLVAWAMGIINVDPIRYGLLFERFLNPERKTMPDVDVDFCAEGRAEVIRHVTEAYGGRDRVAQIVAVGQMKAKAVIRDVGRALGMDYREVDLIAKMVPLKGDVTIASAMAQEPKLAELAKNDPRVSSLLGYATLLEGLPRHASTHASGVVISDQPLWEYLPLCCDTKSPEEDGQRTKAITQYELNAVEANGLIKFDFLGLKTLTLIKHCLALLAKKGEQVDLEGLEFDDEPTFELLRSGKVNGVFQLESHNIRKVLVRLGPRTLEDISCLLALHRPGPLEGGHVDEYIEVRHGRKAPPSFLPQADEILKETHGVIVYQEQVMRLTQALAGFTMGQADNLRKAMGKKDVAAMAEIKPLFLEGAATKGISREKANKVFEDMSKFAHYGFNKSHSLAYAVVTYWTAWLKKHFPAEFMAALLTSEMANRAKLERFINDSNREGLTVLSPDINASDYPFTVLNGRIVYGLGAIKGVGQGAVEAIVATRETEGPFQDLFDFCQKVDSRKVNRRTIEALILSGSFDQSGIAREVMVEAVGEAMKATKTKAKKKAGGGLFDSLTEKEDKPAPRKWPQVEPMSRKDLLLKEKEVLGLFLSGHPLGPYEAAFRTLSAIPINLARTLKHKQKVVMAGSLSRVMMKKDKRDNDYAFGTLEDLENSIELVIFNSQMPKCKECLEVDKVVWLEGELEPSSEKYGPKIKVTEMLPLEKALQSRVKSLYIRAPLEELGQVAEFLKPHLVPMKPEAPKVWVGIIDNLGEAFYHLNDTVELTTTFLTSAQETLGYFGEAKCLTRETPYVSPQ